MLLTGSPCLSEITWLQPRSRLPLFPSDHGAAASRYPFASRTPIVIMKFGNW